jgi:hypothetical protein
VIEVPEAERDHTPIKKVAAKMWAKHPKLRPPRKGATGDAAGFPFDPYVTTAAYADVPGTLIDTGRLGLLTLAWQLVCTVQNITCAIFGSVDGVNFKQLTCLDHLGAALTADIAIVAGANTIATLETQATTGAGGGALRYFKVQAKDTVGGTHGTLNGAFVGKTA